MTSGLLSLLALLSLAPAYETDQLTDRHLPLEDGRDALNGALDELLADAIAETNARTRCAADPDRTREVLAREIWRRTARPTWVLERGLFRAPGFTPYSAWIERSDDLDKRTWDAREDLYATTRPWDALILSVAGPATTVAVDGVWVGTDKFDHFLAFGYVAWRRSRQGELPERVARFDHRTERMFYGLLTSRTYSFGDIAANDDGFRFFSGLLGEDSLLQLDPGGCVTQVAPFDWGDWVDWRYDEALNPPIYAPAVQERIRERIEQEPARYCAAREALGAEAWDAHLAAVVESTDRTGRGVLAERSDPYGLAELCGGEVEAVGSGERRRGRPTAGG